MKSKTKTKLLFTLHVLVSYSFIKLRKFTHKCKILEGLPDLLMLGDFNEGPLLHTVRERFNKEKIYTSIGSAILISVNPYQRLNIFTTKIA